MFTIQGLPCYLRRKAAITSKAFVVDPKTYCWNKAGVDQSGSWHCKQSIFSRAAVANTDSVSIQCVLFCPWLCWTNCWPVCCTVLAIVSELLTCVLYPSCCCLKYWTTDLCAVLVLPLPLNYWPECCIVLALSLNYLTCVLCYPCCCFWTTDLSAVVSLPLPLNYWPVCCAIHAIASELLTSVLCYPCCCLWTTNLCAVLYLPLSCVLCCPCCCLWTTNLCAVLSLLLPLNYWPVCYDVLAVALITDLCAMLSLLLPWLLTYVLCCPCCCRWTTDLCAMLSLLLPWLLTSVLCCPCCCLDYWPVCYAVLAVAYVAQSVSGTQLQVLVQQGEEPFLISSTQAVAFWSMQLWQAAMHMTTVAFWYYCQRAWWLRTKVSWCHLQNYMSRILKVVSEVEHWHSTSTHNVLSI